MKEGLAKSANYQIPTNLVRSRSKLSEAFEMIVEALRIENGSLKIFVHQGKVSPRLEIQANISRQIEG
jgi:hypothetical protein